MEDKIIVMMIERGIIKEHDRALYTYGLRTFRHRVVNALVVIAIAIVLHKTEVVFLILLCMLSLRKYAGGFHESSAIRCFFVSQLMFIMMELTVDVGSANQICYIIATTGSIWGSVMIILKAPAGSMNRPLLERQILKYRKLALGFCAGWNVIMVILHHMMLYKFVFVIAMVLTVQGVLLVIPEKTNATDVMR